MIGNRLKSFILLFFVMTLSCCETEYYEDLSVEKNAVPQSSLSFNTTSSAQSRGETTEQNLLENGGLEEWNMLFTSYGMPTGWLCHNNTNVRQNHKIVYEGSYSAKMQAQEKGKSAILDQLIAVYPGQKIRIRFHFYVEQWKSKGARTYCYFRTAAAEKYNISADDLQSFYDKATYHVIRGGGYNLTYFPHELNIWQTFDETIEVPPTAYYFVFGINSYFGTTIYIDDCSIMDVTMQMPTGIKDVSI